MKAPTLPLTRDLVLIGGGHAHALVLRMWGMDPLPGARVTLINPGPTAPYSGMLPGHVAGHYPREALDIDLVQLARFAGARVILGAASGIDLARREIAVDGRPPVGFDVASIDIGVTSDMPDLPGFADHGVPAKPLGSFASRWQAYLGGNGPASVAVIGGGVAGAELAAAMAHALRGRGRAASVRLVDRGPALSALRPKAAAKLRKALSVQGVEIIEQAQIAQVTAEGLVLADGTQLAADFVTGAAGARPQGWLAETGLALKDGYVSVNACLQSSDPDIFAAGDCAHLSASPRPKAGVFAVREAPILLGNLRRRLAEEGALKPYRPQRDYLKLISLGEQSALADRFGIAPSGPLMWRWKDHIDRKFMRRFTDLPQMTSPPLPVPRAAGSIEALGDKPMCGGCGAKVGRDALGAALAQLPPPRREDVTALPGDDAALLLTGGVRQVMTTDHLRAFVDDPVMMTRIATVHALGDIWAMGAEPQAATLALTLPRMSETLAARTLTEIMATASDILREAGAEVVGGHSSMGDEMTIGLSLTGLCEADPITLRGARQGDDLVLTKPIGSGVVMAAEMQGLARGADVAVALDSMARPQGEAARLLRGAHAMTDVTGFGLAGHLHGILMASGLSAKLDLAAIPLLPGALGLAERGVRSTLYPKNRDAVPGLAGTGALVDLLFDPQTGGGLLAAIPEGASRVTELREAGFEAAVIGRIEGTWPGHIELA
ncbi:hypothetical protein GCM10011415_23520 [Salipiger pallidus]|uniref:Selenophosphate synthase n=1 Tax=Salipiger pallidus TaxID=1775170 RepID=A0A8J2ZK66_9RHOB|nr:selenide, water dikinase SelD [Salipiger pallidus]GGG74353.1 hypothetical protein GCM10011415_23520 [Salipiger pallidus]